ncbi:tRNA (adenosine(37)-N6)-threonylcarbamoyltransferase complex dimerization subunit type 1 TsaB [Sphingomonas sp.]|uniref:tRNA (adenosine(37)-N6)-threonylcarbamoyltransferase complex dimerization subunit type 1 TsaB n=1 Tax=Sphingomonas sp. TaxID=28214 RepID=UPI0025D957F3|nr:tRNA (adenosine(37)-N6)-threonylcarbamoyltransferase complex dimerization subunit type 1 TsaB [Sphingomonas sp.]
MSVLVIETATRACSVALLKDGAVVASFTENVGRGHAERLLPLIAALPGGGRAAAILVDCGPGSFTGIRVGVAAARGLGLGWGVPVTGYSSLALLAAGHFADCRGSDLSVTVAISAGHGQLFVQSFEGNPVRSVTPLRSITPGEAAIVAGSVIVGDAARAIVDDRGSGEAFERTPDAGNARLLPVVLASLPPTPIYGRDADAKPMVPRAPAG